MSQLVLELKTEEDVRAAQERLELDLSRLGALVRLMRARYYIRFFKPDDVESSDFTPLLEQHFEAVQVLILLRQRFRVEIIKLLPLSPHRQPSAYSDMPERLKKKQ